MPFYDIECQECETRGEIFTSMSERGVQKAYPPCEECGGETSRIFTVPALHGMDTAEPPAQFSTQLTTGADPIEVKNKAHHKHLMAEMGVRPFEAHEPAAEIRKRESAKRRKERADSVAEDAIRIANRGNDYIQREIAKMDKEAA